MQGTPRALLSATVLVSALGYFVDVYDLILFSIVRVPSLLALGVPQDQLVPVGVLLLNAQMAGMLLGGLLWGVLGDRRGRVSVLFGSILLYSLANLANAFVTTIPAYAVLRFLAGLGLAGELGAAITLVAESLDKETRAYGTTLVATFGILGAVAAALVGGLTGWRAAYVVGGLMGLALLVGRLKMRESGMYRVLEEKGARGRGDLRLLVRSPRRAWRFAQVVLVGLPIWYVVGVLVTFSPELAEPLRVGSPVAAGMAVLWCYVGLALGDLASGVLSQRMGRKRVMLLFLGLTALLTAAYGTVTGLSLATFYALCFALGVASGYWAVFVTNAAEQFGTNLRATVATTAPNLVRGAVVPVTLGFAALAPSWGLVTSALAVGTGCIVLAMLALWGMDETRGRDLDFVEA